MKRSIYRPSLSQSLWYTIVIVSWSMGIIIGICFTARIGENNISLAMSLPTVTPSIGNLVLLRLSVLLFSVILLRFSRPLIAVLILAVSLSFSYVVSILSAAFQSAGWIVTLLVLSPDALLLSLLIFRILSKPEKWIYSVKKCFIIPFVVICSVSIIECYYIAPFTSALF